MRRAFEQFVRSHGLLAEDEPVVVGVSGGCDSMTLLHLLKDGHPAPVVAHVNYRLRGEASDQDEALVRQYCEENGFACQVNRVEPEAHPTGSKQAWARDLRYAFFEQVAREVGARTVAVAHHLDDRAETLLLNLFRGAGPRGLAAMPVERRLAVAREVRLIRPLLFARRAEIEAFAREEEVPWREDASNAELSYARNRLRQVVMPVLIEQFGEAVVPNVARAAKLLAELVGLYPEVEAFRIGERALSVEALLEADGHIRRRVLLDALARWIPDATRSEVVSRRVETLLTSQTGRFVPFEAGNVWRDRERLVFGKRTESDTRNVQIESVEAPPMLKDNDPWVEYVDADALREPLQVRLWQDGDVLVPLGLGHRKLVSDLLTDARVPTHERRQIRVLTSDGRIVWVIGVRLDDRFKLTEQTRNVYRLSFAPPL